MNELLKKDLMERANSLYDYFSDLIREQMPSNGYVTKFEFEIKDKDEINGKAWCENGVDHVEINSGVIQLYYDYFTKVMEYDKVKLLRHLGIDKEEDILKKYSLEGITYNNGVPEIFDSKVIDDSKAKLLEILTARFIVLHELGHILNGHCKFLENELYISGIKFIPMYFDKIEEKLNKNNALDIRTLEMDADAFAATQSMIHVLFLYLNFNSQVSVKMKPEDLFYWWSFAIRSHFLMCEDQFMDQVYYKKMTHLPSSARWSMICASALDVLDLYNHTSQVKENYKSLIIQGAKDAEIKFNDIKFTNYNWINEVADNAHYIEYRNEVNSNWDKIRVRLQKYTRLPLYDNQ